MVTNNTHKYKINCVFVETTCAAFVCWLAFSIVEPKECSYFFKEFFNISKLISLKSGSYVPNIWEKH